MTPVGAVLDRAGARWALIGALAALRYRDEPRLTNDIDVLAERVDGLSDAFAADGFDVREVADTGEAPHLLLLRRGALRADVLLAVVETSTSPWTARPTASCPSRT